MSLYSFIFNIFFKRLDAEFAHHIGMFAIRAAHRLRITKLAKIDRRVENVSVLGLNFPGVFGLAAGFDKNAVAVRALGELGFSHVEVGTVTALAQPGNEKPRLFRLVADSALINRMGFNNQGAEIVSQRLKKLRNSGQKLPIIGVNIGKSKVVDVADAAQDYATSTRLLAPFADYLAINVSSPNTPGLRSLQSVSSLRPILAAVQTELAKLGLNLPVLVKIAPDLADEDIIEVAQLAIEMKLAGIIATNTTVSRTGLKTDATMIEKFGAGGLSGAPLKSRSIEVLDLLAHAVGGRLAIISVGGVETADDVTQRLSHGADLVQGYTGFIYRGPLWARQINLEVSAKK